MCNLFRSRRNSHQATIPNTARESYLSHQAAPEADLVRPSEMALVIAIGRMRVPVAVPMRWGWSRDFNPTIYNARAEKVGTGMWAQASRCLFLVSDYYETDKTTGQKWRIYAKRPVVTSGFYVPGLWEIGPEKRLFAAMLTEPASSLLDGMNDRQPCAFADWREMEPWINGGNLPNRTKLHLAKEQEAANRQSLQDIQERNHSHLAWRLRQEADRNSPDGPTLPGL
ncbi:hypothetical protein llg_43450 [Luteolibacter sp. LG18]|nr:hypothetical protein llg_07410 [Luteolibacter sp. LG18]BCU79630.1 hypothetical protein llg_43450 [Luteolibacter sp. LG18]